MGITGSLGVYGYRVGVYVYEGGGDINASMNSPHKFTIHRMNSRFIAQIHVSPHTQVKSATRCYLPWRTRSLECRTITTITVVY